jgi:hypothetical protein
MAKPMSCTNEQIEYIKYLYTLDTKDRPTRLEIAKQLGRSKNSITHVVQKLGLRKKNNTINHTFFSMPTDLSSYWAGFIAGDGYITTQGRGRVSIQLDEKDSYHLVQFKHDTEFSGPVCSGTKVEKRGAPWTTGREYAKCTIQCTSHQWVQDLSSIYNITPRKTYTLQPPNITSLPLVCAYIVGLIDSDGYIGKYRRSEKTWVGIEFGISGTRSLLEWVKGIFDTHYPSSEHASTRLPRNSNVHQENGKPLCTLNISGTRAMAILAWLDNINIPKLPRKWEIYRGMLGV